MDGRERSLARVVSAALVVAVLHPAVLLVVDDRHDDFPLSSYPMFTRDRGRTVQVATVVAVDGSGDVHRLSPEEIAGTDQVMLAVTAVQQAVDGGAGGPDRLCAEVAQRLDPMPASWLEVVVETHDAVAWAGGDRDPLDREVVTTCPAP